MVIRITLERVAHSKNHFLVERLADNLQTYWKPIRSEPAWNRCRRKACHIEWSAKSRRNLKDSFLLGADLAYRFADLHRCIRQGRSDKHVNLLHFFPQRRFPGEAHPLSVDVGRGER